MKISKCDIHQGTIFNGEASYNKQISFSNGEKMGTKESLKLKTHSEEPAMWAICQILTWNMTYTEGPSMWGTINHWNTTYTEEQTIWENYQSKYNIYLETKRDWTHAWSINQPVDETGTCAPNAW